MSRHLLSAGSLRLATSLTALAAALLAPAAHAADWSDTSIGFRTGNRFAEPFGTNDIKKNIINLTHASGYQYGTNLFKAGPMRGLGLTGPGATAKTPMVRAEYHFQVGARRAACRPAPCSPFDQAPRLIPSRGAALPMRESSGAHLRPDT